MDWDGPVKTDRELKQVDFQVVFKLMRRAVAQSGVAKVEVKVDVEVPGDIQAGFFQRGKKGISEQEFGLNGAPIDFDLDVIVGVAGSAETGQGINLVDAGAAGDAGVLAAPIGVNNQARRGLAQHQGLLQGQQQEFGGQLRGQVPAHHAPGAGVAPGG